MFRGTGVVGFNCGAGSLAGMPSVEIQTGAAGGVGSDGEAKVTLAGLIGLLVDMMAG